MKSRVANLGLLTGLSVALLTLSALLSAPAHASGAHTLYVTTTQDELADDGYCSLREAIRAVNLQTASGSTPGECPAGGGDDTILVPAGIYTLTIPGMTETAGLTGDLNMTRSVALVGASPATTIIDANQLDRVLDVAANITVTLSGLTLQNGYRPSDLSGPHYSGGGIENAGTLMVTDTIVQNNWATFGAGGIDSSGTLSLTHSTVRGNSVGSGAGGIAGPGLYLDDVLVSDNETGVGPAGGLAGQGAILNSTFTRNTAYGHSTIFLDGGSLSLVNTSVMSNTGQGIYIYYDGSLRVDRSAIIDNDSDGIYEFQGTIVSISNSTVSGNGGDGVFGEPGFGERMDLNNVTAAANGKHGIEMGDSGYFNFDLQNTLVAGNAGGDCAGNFVSHGYNLIQDTTGCVLSGTLTGNRSGVSPLLGPLQDNGGPTWTQALLSGSPAIDAGNPAGCRDDLGQLLQTDQRGFMRVFDGNNDGKAICDIGAFEYGSSLFPGFVPSVWLYLPLIRH